MGRSAILAAVLCATLLAGCNEVSGLRDAPAPSSRPAVEQPEAEGPDPESLALVAYYAKVETGHRTRGLLRADGGGPDVPFDAERLARTFQSIAFSREFTDAGTRLVRKSGDSILHKWIAPIRFEPMFGAAVPDIQRTEDRNAINLFADRLARVTGHPISSVSRNGNFRVLVVTEEERSAIGPTLRRLVPEIRQQEIDLIEELDRATYCVVVASAPADDGVLTRAVAIIRAELPPLLRQSCIHEELAQGLGLANDSPAARPSIFNDDDEFGRLTAMDEKMLQMLYDPRLLPGMDAETARPIVNELAKALSEPAI